MPFAFPSSPTVGQQSVQNGRAYQWNGSAWELVAIIPPHTHLAGEVTSGVFDIARIPTGTSSVTVCVGNDARLSDARTPTSHSHSVSDIPVVLERQVAIGNSGTATTLSLANGSVQTVTLTGNCTFAMPAASAGASLTLVLTQGGAFTATFSGVLWQNGGAPTITATSNKVDILVFVSNGASWYGTAAQNF